MIYSTKDGDVLDEIVFRYYGKTAGYVERVLAANRHLADRGAIYPADVQIVLPDIRTENVTAEVTIWD